jgi:TolB protein
MKILFILMLMVVLPRSALSDQSGYIDVTASGKRQLKLAVEIPHAQNNAVPNENAAKEMAGVIAFDINMSGIVGADIKEPLPLAGGLMFGATDFAPWLSAGYDLLVRGEYGITGDNLTVEFRLYDVLNNKMMTAKRYLGKNKDLRRFAHSFCDEILLQMTGERGPFTTHIAFVTTQYVNKELAIMDWDGHNLLPLTRNGSINLNPDISPDGREIIFTSYKRGNPDLFKRALSSTVEIPLSKRKGLNITGAWSPDGTKIALSLSKDGNAEIYTIAKDGSNPQRLTVNPAIEVSPVWSPDGSHIAFVSDRLGKPQIFVMNANGGNVRRLTTAGAYNVNPRWSPKGDRIAYARMQGGGEFNIFVINADGSGDTQLTTTGSNENPAWSPDGRFIAFSSKRGGPAAIYVMRADGGGQVRVSQGKWNGTQPAWGSR